MFGKMEMFREAVADYTTVSLLPLPIPISYFVYVFHGIIVVALFSMSVSTCQSVFPSTSQDSLSLSLYLSLSDTHIFFPFPSLFLYVSNYLSFSVCVRQSHWIPATLTLITTEALLWTGLEVLMLL